MNKLLKIKKVFQNDEILETIRNKKFYLLSENEKKLLNIYLNDKKLVKYKKEFINSFINRLNNLHNDILESYFNELKDVCNLDIQIGVVYNIPTKTAKVKNKPEGYSKDAYFNHVIEKENYDELYNIYGLREIERDSNILDGGKNY